MSEATPTPSSPVDKARAKAEEAVGKVKATAEQALGQARKTAEGLVEKVKGLKP